MPKCKTQWKFVACLFEASGNSFRITEANQENARLLFKSNSKVSSSMRREIVYDEEKLGAYFFQILDAVKLREWAAEMSISLKRFNQEIFCLALAYEFYSYFLSDIESDSYEYVVSKYNEIHEERDKRAITALRRVLAHSNKEIKDVFEINNYGKIEGTKTCSVFLRTLMIKEISFNRFALTELRKYLRNNVIYYVEDSWFGANKTIDPELVYKAQERIRKYESERPEFYKEGFGEMMISLLLDKLMGAPKLFNRIQTSNSGGPTFFESVHLGAVSKGDKEFFQLVIGVSGIRNDLEESIRKAFELIREVCSKNDEILDFISKPLMNKDLPDDVLSVFYEYLYDVSTKHLNPIDEGFGVCICYSPVIDKSYHLHAAEYKEEMNKRISEDMEEAKDIIKKTVGEYSFQFPLSFYFLPLNDAEEESKDLFASLKG